MQIPQNIQENADMKQYTSFRAGGSAKYFAKVESAEELTEFKEFAKEASLPYFILGLGSNVVVSDAGYEGLIIKLGKKFSHFKFDKETLTAGAATPLSILARMSATMGFSGIHLLAGIPGSVGGAVAMNAGAYGEEIAQTLTEVKVQEENGTIQNYSKEECGFDYRHSAFQNTKSIILEASFRLEAANSKELLDAQAEVLAERKAKQPLELPSAGSMFKRPVRGFPGALIEQAGLKGFAIGGAQVSPKHANFIVNTGCATAQNIYDLSQLIRDRVKTLSGIQLEREVIFLGKF